MGKLLYLTVRQYANLWDKHENSIYKRISEGKILTIPEPDGGRGRLIPVCQCGDNYFPGRSLCLSCKKDLEVEQVKK